MATSELIGNAARAGDLAWIALDVDRGRIVGARGDGVGMRELCGEVRGLGLLAAAAVPGDDLALDALHDALGPAVRATSGSDRVVVAMSGGVDSAVALLEAKDAGLEPVGLTLRLWTDPHGPSSERACCSPEAVVAARSTCHSLGIPHVTLDQREGFRHAIVSPFVAAYERGETPNPCIRCNGAFRFATFFSFARRIGAARVATGHYARIRPHRGRLLLARPADADKDQTYMLARVDPRVLDRLWFPLGDRTKDDVRGQALAEGLAAAGRPESQEACFLGGADYREFLARQGLEPRTGAIVDEDGTELGRHAGHWAFTAGQRRGLGVAVGEPVYAVRTVPRTNTVVVGPRSSLARTRVTVRSGRLYVPVDRADVKLRYRSPATPARVEHAGRGFRLHLEEPAYGVSPGQAAVLYEGDAVVGAGLISASA